MVNRRLIVSFAVTNRTAERSRLKKIKNDRRSTVTERWSVELFGIGTFSFLSIL